MSANTSEGTEASPATSGAGRGNRNRNQRTGGRGGSRRNTTTTNAANTFKGTVTDMNGHVFQCYGEATEKNQFARTMEELSNYVGLHFKHHSADIKKMLQLMADATLTPPSDPSPSATLTENLIWQKEVDMFVKRRETYSNNKCALYSVVWGQCSEAMQAKIKSNDNYENIHENNNSLDLIAAIKGISYKFESQKNLYVALDNAKTAFYTYRQGPEESNPNYMSNFTNTIDVIEHYGGSIGDDRALLLEELKPDDENTASKKAIEVARETAKRKAYAIAFLKRSDKVRYGQLITDLENQHTMGNDNYPTNITETYNLLTNYKKPRTVPPRRSGETNTNTSTTPVVQEGMTFVQREAPPPIETIQCYNCQRMGHYASDCTQPSVPRNREQNNTTAVVQFLQDTRDNTPGEEPITMEQSDDEEDNDSDGVNFSFIQDTNVNMTNTHMINQNWVLLDSESTVNIFSNARFLTNIRHCGNAHGLRVHTNGGSQDTNMIGDLPGFGPVWYNKGSLANILSLAAVRKVCRVTMDTLEEAAIVVHKKNGEKMKFQESKNGLYYHDAKASNTKSTAYSFVNSVKENKKLYSQRQLENAELAKRVYELVGRPSHATFTKMIRENQLKHCPITVEDANRALHIYGPDVAALRGKTTRTTPTHVPPDQIRPLPLDIIQAHGNITICSDIFFVDGHAFFSTISRNINFITLEYIPSRAIIKHILPCLQTVNNTYKARGFNITTMHADEEFSTLAAPLLALNGIHLNTAATNEHVPEIERAIRTIKERNRATVSGLPFKHYPKILKLALVSNAVTWLNMLPHADGISNTMSPRTLITGITADYNIHCRVPIGAYCEVHNENTPSNTETPRTSYAIALNPTGNLQGSYHFLSLTTGKRISRRRWTELPMTDAVINRVHTLALAEHPQAAHANNFVFEWAANNPIVDHAQLDQAQPQAVPLEGATDTDDDNTEEDNKDDSSDEESGADDNSDDESGADNNSDDESGANKTEEDKNNSDEESGASNETEFAYHGQYEVFNEEVHHDEDDATLDQGEDGHKNEIAKTAKVAMLDEAEENQVTTDVTSHDNTDAQGAHNMDAQGAHNMENEGAQHHEETAPNTQHYNLRGKKINYTHKYAQQFMQATDKTTPMGPSTDTANNLRNHILSTGFLFNQMSAKAGVKAFGDKAVNAIVQEYKQLDEKKAFKPRNVNSLTILERKRALRSITLVKEKRCGRIKGRTVADGRGQREYITHDESTSPTVSIEGLMISIAIDAKEGRHVATADVEGAYLHADMDETVIMVFEGEMVDYMVEANPTKYGPCVIVTKSGKKLLYVELLKALYGCVKSALLWYKLFTSTLAEMGFVLNPYDPCVANKVINGKQCTICWYVDDLKISHVDLRVVNNIITKIEERYGKMTVTRGNKHVYVGMDIEYTQNGEAKICMKDYINEAIEAFPEDCTKLAKTPAGPHLFEVNDACTKLNEEDRKIFHSITAKLLFVAKRARPDIQVPIAFLTSRVTKADKDDWKKLKRLLEYLHSTINMPLTISIDNLSIIKTWVDAAYALHADMRSHTGGNIMMGKGILYGKSSKQKINTKSSTEAELDGASDFLSQTIWTRNFIEAQGHTVSSSDYYQDNMSAMKMEQNGRSSAGQRSRHINIRYFFIKDRIANGEINLIHCPTESMIADFFTKPLQGSLFKKFRDIIMGITHFSTLLVPTMAEARSVLDNDIFKAKTTTNVVTNHLPITKEKVPEAHEKKENKLLKVSFKGTQDYFKNQSID